MGEQYVLKHKEIPVAAVSLNEDFGLSEIDEIYDMERMPFGLKYRDNEKAYFRQLSDWIEKRGLSESRMDFVDIRQSLDAKNSSEISLGVFSLNLTDHYWMHKTNKDLRWADLNCFDNDFNEVIEFDNDTIDYETFKETVAPDLTVDGALRKKWVMKDTERYLLKDGRWDDMQEPFNEVIVSNILQKFGIDHVEYGLLRSEKTHKPLSICKCMVSRDTEFITAQVVLDTELNQGRDNYTKFIEICTNKGISNIKKNLDAMIAIDYLIGNTDRHTGNFGIIRDANTLQWLNMVPLFDNGNSFCYNNREIDDIAKKIDTQCRWFKGSNRERLELIAYPEWYSPEKGRELSGVVFEGLAHNDRMSEEKREKLAEIVDLRVSEFERIIDW